MRKTDGSTNRYKAHPQLHAVSTGRQSPDTFVQIACEIHPYLTFFHLREKELPPRELWRLIERLVTKGFPLDKLVVNDRADAAWCAGAAGVQLPGSGLPPAAVKQRFPGLRVGVSVHSPQEARQAAAAGADYVLAGHIYPTASKPGLEPRGIGWLREAAENCDVPVIAIGGIKPQHAEELLSAGAGGIAVLSGIWNADHPAEAAERYRKCLLLASGMYEEELRL
ncbi:thiamine phosphate synthase [Paenibacillus lutrae]|uniref:Thiazole tautomerase TenI n=1 Tax=Paenibacillus lutrae TaxID=2078573 RepID=A0A7X3FHU1_9BACL|nr:thiamine phosphate synthase [Paenibacillus lutrae]MVO99891.1 thiazole tautomerase TenI [Paenibacillus lutrae]